jgi:biotin carboxyl carrier protein
MNASEQPAGAPAAPPARKWTYAVLALAFLFVLMPFLFWQQTWFGRPLTDEELGQGLADDEHPRKIQHALAQVADRIVRGDAAVRRWYPQVAALGAHRVDEIRITAAWTLGQDNSAPEFHQALLPMLRDAHPLVRRNAALALVRFRDPSGHDEILAMLRPYALASPRAGGLAQRLKPGDVVNPGTLLGRIRSGEAEQELRSTLPGTVERWLAGEGAAVVAGQEMVSIAPDSAMVWEALRALVLIGRPEDIAAIERYTAVLPDMPEQVRRQARETIRAIEKRAKP